MIGEISFHKTLSHMFPPDRPIYMQFIRQEKVIGFFSLDLTLSLSIAPIFDNKKWCIFSLHDTDCGSEIIFPPTLESCQEHQGADIIL
jgi:hypothetical protein